MNAIIATNNMCLNIKTIEMELKAQQKDSLCYNKIEKLSYIITLLAEPLILASIELFISRSI